MLGFVFYTSDQWAWVFAAVVNALFVLYFVAMKYCACCKGQYKRRAWAQMPPIGSAVGTTAAALTALAVGAGAGVVAVALAAVRRSRSCSLRHHIDYVAGTTLAVDC